MNIKRGDIFWIAQSKYRPAVGCVQKPGRPGIVVSNDANNACSNTLEIVYLTGKPKKDLPTHCAINSSTMPSIALCEQVTTVSDEQLRGYIGHCSAKEMAEVDRCIAISLGLQERRAVFSNEEIADMFDRLTQGEKDLAAANARVELLQKMYNDLLVRTIG